MGRYESILTKIRLKPKLDLIKQTKRIESDCVACKRATLDAPNCDWCKQ